MSSTLHVVMYHYVRDIPNTRFPGIKGMLVDEFRDQVRRLRERFEMTSLEAALEFLRGTYSPTRDICLLTFDDGLKEHADIVTPILVEERIAGMFFPVTSAMDGRVAPVHMAHFLMSIVGFDAFRKEFIERLGTVPEVPAGHEIPYAHENPEAGAFKYLFNFILDPRSRDAIVRAMFDERIGNESAFARSLYLSWEDGRAMQGAGMIMGGHSHAHRPLATLSGDALVEDLGTSTAMLKSRLAPQPLWPFAYPYGSKPSFNAHVAREVEAAGYCCAFSTFVGANAVGTDAFVIKRFDCIDRSLP